MDEPNILVEGLGFPEGPRWRDGELWFSDFIAKTVSSVSLGGVVRTRAVLEDMPSGIGFLPDGQARTGSVLTMRARSGWGLRTRTSSFGRGREEPSSTAFRCRGAWRVRLVARTGARSFSSV